MSFDLLRATFLAILQGLTEFLPISSSAHLILPAALLGWEDQGLAFDMAVHLGTLLAVLLYFRQDLQAIAMAMLAQLRGKALTEPGRLGWLLVLATIPVLIAGVMLKDLAETSLRSVAVITITTLLFALLLWVADRSGTRQYSLQQLNWKTALLIGCAQVLSLVPGTSRSGITMTAALFCHFDREAASRFSFLLSIPVTTGASLLLFLDLLEAPSVNWAELFYALVVAAVTAYACIHYFLKLIASLGFLPFVLYRLALGGVLLLYLLVS
jgi:undecaprenyl-diphosphatase